VLNSSNVHPLATAQISCFPDIAKLCC